ncbi:MFS general substrate transporter [Neoconidiobolus thromboides FSU 785]|nr:MFS general substrate transporter [Neoconidiobolus thromboides FSU 785]
MGDISKDINKGEPEEFRMSKFDDEGSIISLETQFKENDTEKEDARYTITGIRFHLLMFGLFLVIFTSILDHTILAAALGHIASDFNALSDMAWLPASYMLTTTALIPLYGKLSDIFGRRNTLIAALTIFMVGSIMCGASSSIHMLIGSRAFSGIGGGGLIALAIIVISDVVPLKSRSLYLSMTGIFFIIAVVSGPVIGGLISDNLSWRYNFYLNVPISLITLVITAIFLNFKQEMQPLRLQLKRIDFLGSISIIVSTVFLLLGLNWGGNEYPWLSWEVLVPLGISVVSLLLFIFVELRVAKEPILPSSIFTRNVISANITNLLNGFPFYVSVNYIPIYHQIVNNKSATMSAFELFPMMISIVILSALAGYYTSKTGRYRIFNVLGTGLILVGVCLMFLLRKDITRFEEITIVLLIGCGYGLCTQNCTILSQAAVKESEVASVTSLLNFTANLGGVLGLAIIGSIYKNALNYYLMESLPGLDSKLLTSSLDSISILSEEEVLLYKLSYVSALKYAYITMIPFCTISFIASLFLIHIPLVKSEPVLEPKIAKETV